MVELLGVLGRAPWPVWVGAGGLLALLMLAKLVAERARRRTYQEILSKCEPGTLLIDMDRRRCLVLCRMELPPRTIPALAGSGRHQ